MQNDKIYSEITGSLVRTRFEANMLLAELDVLEKSLYKIGEGDFEWALEKGIRAKTAYAIRQTIGGVKPEEFLAKLRQNINALNYLGITIAFEPNLESISRFYVWAKQNLGEGIALNIQIDKSILGGAIIEYKGKVASFTLINKVNQYYSENHVNV